MNNKSNTEKNYKNKAERKFSVDGQIRAIMNFDKIINSSLDGLWITDADGKFLQVNRAAEKLYNIKKEI